MNNHYFVLNCKQILKHPKLASKYANKSICINADQNLIADQ